MAGTSRSQFALAVALGVGLLAALGLLIFQSRRLSEMRRQRDAELQSLRETRRALRETERRGPPPSAAPQAPPLDEKSVIAQRNATIAQLNHELSQANISISQLQSQLADAKKTSEAKLASAQDQNQQELAGLQTQLEDLTRQFNSAQAALNGSRQRIASLEAANTKLRSEKSASSARATEREQLLNELQDLDRRREAYLSSITDRCRDIVNRFRAMSGMLDSSRQPESSAFSGAALDLVQNAITLADDDLRHLSDLNARAFRLEKQLSKK